MERKFEIKKMGSSINDFLSTEELEQRLEMDSMFNLWSFIGSTLEQPAQCDPYCNDCSTYCSSDCTGYVCAAHCDSNCVGACMVFCGDGIY